MIAIRGRLRTPPGGLAQPRRRVRHRRHRTAAADLRRAARAQGQDRPALGAQPAPHPDPGDRIRLGRIDPQLRRRVRHGPLRRRPTRRVLHRRRRLAALQPGAGQLAGQYAIDMFIGSSLQIDARRQLLHRDRRTAVRASVAHRTWATIRTGGATPSAAWLDLAHGDGAARRGRKLVVQMAQTFQRRQACRRSSRPSTPSRSARRPACRCRR